MDGGNREMKGHGMVQAKRNRMHVAPTPSKYRRSGVQGSTEVRFPKLFFGMEGVRHSKHKTLEGTTYRAQLDKSAFFRFVTPLIFAGSIPRDGISRTSVKSATHGALARMMGYRCRESYTRNSRRAPRLVARQLGRLVKGSVYRFLFPEGEERWKQGEFNMPSAREMRANPEFQKYWKYARADYKHYSYVPGWILDESTPGTPYQKLVLLALAFLGLFDLDANGHCAGELQKPLLTIATLIGTSRDQVRSALAFWQEQGILQIKEHEGHWEINGKEVPAGTAGAAWRQPPNSIFYVPGREFNAETCAEEMDRFLKAAESVRNTPWFAAMAGIHADALREWKDTRQLIRTFWTECRRRMAAAHVPPKLIEAAIPKAAQ